MTDYNNIKFEGQSKEWKNTDWKTVLPIELQSKATRTSDLQFNESGRGAIFSFVTANKANSASFALSIRTKDNSGNVITLASFTAITANGTAVYWLYPTADKTATVNSGATLYATISLPRVWYAVLTSAGNGTTDAIDTELHVTYVL